MPRSPKPSKLTKKFRADTDLIQGGKSRGQIPFLSVICPFNNCLLQSDFALRRKQPGSQEGQRPPLSANRLPNPPRPTSLRLIPADSSWCLWSPGRRVPSHHTQTQRRQTCSVLSCLVPTRPPSQIREGHTTEVVRFPTVVFMSFSRFIS